MKTAKVLFYYFLWHYSRAIKEGFHIWKNFMWFLYNFFSVRLLLKTFFSRFERQGEGYKRGLYIEHNLSVLLVNTLMRIVGMVLRTFVILIGLISLLIGLILGIIALIVWLFLPVIIFFSIVIGLAKVL